MIFNLVIITYCSFIDFINQILEYSANNANTIKLPAFVIRAGRVISIPADS